MLLMSGQSSFEMVGERGLTGSPGTVERHVRRRPYARHQIDDLKNDV